ncbi:hypothetical protein [Poseidonibacter sp.]|uniref:hypothetical protein n=1 Tax=Poseidonibacter sp. TaxID=2321188 RepID=UPI00359E274B
MEILFLFIILILIMVFIFKSKFNSSTKVDKETDYSQESINILEKYFGSKNFYQNIDAIDLKNKLEIKANHRKKLQAIVKNALHKIDVHSTFSINTNKPYNDLTKLKVSANEVIDYSIRNNITMKDNISILFLTITNESIKEVLDDEFDEQKYIEIFYELLPGFIQRYNNKANN